MLLAKEVQQQTRTDWHRAPAAYEAFAEAVKTWLDFLKPVPMAGSTGVQAGQSEADISAGDDPKTLGRAIARTLNNNPPDQLRRIRNANLKRIWETDS